MFLILQAHGFHKMWEEFVRAIDPEGEENAHKVTFHVCLHNLIAVAKKHVLICGSYFLTSKGPAPDG